MDIKESLKCLGLSGSRFKAWNCASFASIAGSHDAVGSGGIPQSAKPGIGGGFKRSRTDMISSASEKEVASVWLSSISSGGGGGGGGGDSVGAEPLAMSSDIRARGWLFKCAGRRMSTWDLGRSRASGKAEGETLDGLSYPRQKKTQPTKRETIVPSAGEETLTLLTVPLAMVFEVEATIASESL